MNFFDPTGMCSYNDNGKPVSGLCGALGHQAAQDLVDQQLSDPNSIASDLNAAAEDNGNLVTVSVDADAQTQADIYGTVNSVGSIEPDGAEITIGAPADIQVRYDDGSIGREQSQMEDAFEHEMSHALASERDGMTNISSSDRTMEAGPTPSEIAAPLGEVGTINRSNDYRDSSERGYERMCHRGSC